MFHFISMQHVQLVRCTVHCKQQYIVFTSYCCAFYTTNGLIHVSNAKPADLKHVRSSQSVQPLSSLGENGAKIPTFLVDFVCVCFCSCCFFSFSVSLSCSSTRIAHHKWDFQRNCLHLRSVGIFLNCKD